jgi:hypothetical protein
VKTRALDGNAGNERLYVYTWPTSTASNVEKKKEATVAAVIDKLR